MGLLGNISSAEKSIKNIYDYFEKLDKKLNDVSPKIAKIAKDTAQVDNKGAVGKTASRALGTDTAKFSSQSMNNIVDQHLGAISAANANYQKASATMGAISAGVSAIGGIGKAMFGMMPDVGAVVGRATSYYDAGVMSGYGNRQRIATATFSGLRGGLTSPGSDAAVAQYLAATGVNFSANPQSQYMRTVGAVGNLSKYMNMDNGAAAQAVTGFYTGKGSRNLMQTMGIWTSDPLTGKTRGIGSIMNDIGNRLSNGRRLTVQGVNDSFLRGNLGVDLKGMGLSDDQQQIMKQFLIEKAKGNNMDLSNSKTMDALAKKAGVNPQAALQAINSSNTSAMQNAESSYLAGIQAAVPLIQGMNDAMKGFVQTMGGVNAMAATMQGSPSGAGLLGIGSSLINGAAGIGGNLALMKMAGGKLTGGAGGFGGIIGKAGGAIGKMGSRLLKGGAYGMGGQVAGMVARPVVKALGGSDKTANQWANGLSGAGTGAMIGAMIPILGETGVSEAAGALIGGLMGYYGGGGGNAAPSNDTPSKTDASGVWLIYPVKGSYTLGAGYGASADNLWGKGKTHGGLDFFCTNIPVNASASGTVSGIDYSNGLGKHVRINHGNGYTTVYAHLSSTSVTKGQKVNQGDTIGISGNSGKSASGDALGYHVHLALCTGDGKLGTNAIDPTPHIKGGFPTRWTPSKDTGTTLSGKDMKENSTPLASNSQPMATPSTDTSGGTASLVPAGYSPQVASASNLVATSQSGISAGNPGGLLDNSSASSSKNTTMLKALKKAGFSGDGLSTAAAVALASSHGNASMHAHVGSQDKYGLFQIDFGGDKATKLKQHYALKNVNQALDPLTNAKIAFDMSKQGTDWSSFPEYANSDYKKYNTGAPRAKNGRSYVANDGPINVHAGEAILTSEQADVWRDAIKTSYASKNAGANVTIQVNVLQASEAEAKRLATMVKSYIEDDKLTSTMRSF